MQVPFKKFLHGCRLDFPDLLLPLRLLILDALLPLGVGCSEGGAAFGVGFARYSRAGNCIDLLSNTDPLLSTDSKFLVLSHCHLIPCDSLPLPLFQFSRAWRRNFVIEVSDLYSSSPLSSIFDNRASTSSVVKFPCRKIFIQF